MRLNSLYVVPSLVVAIQIRIPTGCISSQSTQWCNLVISPLLPWRVSPKVASPRCFTFHISTSLHRPCVFGWRRHSVRVWGTAVFLTGQIKTRDGPQGAWGCEAFDMSRKSGVSHLHCPISAQQWEQQWGVIMNIPPAVLPDKPLGFACRFFCNSFLTSDPFPFPLKSSPVRSVPKSQLAFEICFWKVS